MSIPVHPCAAIGCRLTINRRFAFCFGHWNLLPAEMRDTIEINYANLENLRGARRRYEVAILRAKILIGGIEKREVAGEEYDLAELETEMQPA